MKKILFLLTVTACLVMASCTESADKITSRQITAKFNKKLDEAAMTESFTTLRVGTYEVSQQTRFELKRLEAAGVISYSEEHFAWWEKSTSKKRVTTYVTRSYWGYTWSEPVTSSKTVTDYNYQDHVIATVALTNKGKRLMVDSIPGPKDIVDKDMIQPSLSDKTYPEDKVSDAWDFPELPNPWLAQEEPSAEEPVAEKPQKEEKPVVDDEPAEEEAEPSDGIERNDEAVYRKYLDALAACSEETVILRSHAFKAVKAINIQIADDEGSRLARAQVIVEIKNATDAGRVQNHVIDGMKDIVTVVLLYYIDQGWVIVNMSDMNELVDEFSDAVGKFTNPLEEVEEVVEDSWDY